MSILELVLVSFVNLAGLCAEAVFIWGDKAISTRCSLMNTILEFIYKIVHGTRIVWSFAGSCVRAGVFSEGVALQWRLWEIWVWKRSVFASSKMSSWNECTLDKIYCSMLKLSDTFSLPEKLVLEQKERVLGCEHMPVSPCLNGIWRCTHGQCYVNEVRFLMHPNFEWCCHVTC